MAVRESQIDSLANQLVRGLVAAGAIRAKGEEKDLAACLIEFMSENFEQEAAIDAEADKMAEDLARKDTRADVTRLRAMIRQRLAEKKGFTL